MAKQNLVRNIDSLRSKAAALPHSPGVYIMRGADGNVIYVGKSRSLRDRVSQYFHGSHDIKTQRMADSVYDFEFIVCSTEMEALTLENRLIKHHTPKYNMKLKDAKSYPYIRLGIKSDYPKISMTRTRLADGALYFGPYSSTQTVYSVIASLERTLRIPSCKKKFPADIGKSRPCVNYQIGRCVGLCTGNISKEEYKDIIATAADILRGGTSGAIKALTEDMYRFSESMEFEKAARCRDTVSALRKLGEKQTAVSSPDVECDVFGFCPANNTESGHDSISVFYIRSGYVSDRDHFLFDDSAIVDGEDESPVMSFITRLYSSREYIPREILLSFELSDSDSELLGDYLSEKAGRKVYVKTPKRGASKSICDLATEDAKLHAENKVSKHKATEKMLGRLAEMLSLEVFPERIEAFDISNLGSEHITAGMVAAVDGKLVKSEYRSYSIRSITAPDDYSAMKEAVLRRMTHAGETLADGSRAPSPDLLLLDGGIGHVNVVEEALAEGNYYVPVFGMVKDDRHKTRTLVSSSGEIDISKQTDIFRFIYSIQEEVHRYTVGRMTNAKRKTLKRSTLENIDGIGPAKAKKLLRHFGSMTAVKNATADELKAVGGITEKDANNIIAYYSKDNKAN